MLQSNSTLVVNKPCDNFFWGATVFKRLQQINTHNLIDFDQMANQKMAFTYHLHRRISKAHRLNLIHKIKRYTRPYTFTYTKCYRKIGTKFE